MTLTMSHLHQTATSFLTAFTTLSASDHVTLRAANCTHLFAPASLNIAPKTNDQFANHLNANLIPLLSSFPVIAKEMHLHITPTGGQATVWATGTPVFRPEVMDGNEKEWAYTGEYIFILDIDEEGKVVRVLEFLDSLATERLRILMVRARRNMGTVAEAW